MSNESIKAVTRKVVKMSEKEKRFDFLLFIIPVIIKMLGNVDVCNQHLFCYINLLHLLFFGEGQVKVGVQQLNFSQCFITLSSSRSHYFQLFQ